VALTRSNSLVCTDSLSTASSALTEPSSGNGCGARDAADNRVASSTASKRDGPVQSGERVSARRLASSGMTGATSLHTGKRSRCRALKSTCCSALARAEASTALTALRGKLVVRVVVSSMRWRSCSPLLRAVERSCAPRLIWKTALPFGSCNSARAALDRFAKVRPAIGVPASTVRPAVFKGLTTWVCQSTRLPAS